jgi:esterase/lipase
MLRVIFIGLIQVTSFKRCKENIMTEDIQETQEEAQEEAQAQPCNWELFNEYVDTVQKEYPKAVEGVKTSTRRVRVALNEIKKLCVVLRKEASDFVK